MREVCLPLNTSMFSTVKSPNMPSEREDHCMVSLPDGKVMILGGNNGIHPDPFTIQHKSVLRFDPATNTFDDMPSLKKDRSGASCTVFYSQFQFMKLTIYNHFKNL